MHHRAPHGLSLPESQGLPERGCRLPVGMRHGPMPFHSDCGSLRWRRVAARPMDGPPGAETPRTGLTVRPWKMKDESETCGAGFAARSDARGA